jgi:hypothetical protein
MTDSNIDRIGKGLSEAGHASFDEAAKLGNQLHDYLVKLGSSKELTDAKHKVLEVLQHVKEHISKGHTS